VSSTCHRSGNIWHHSGNIWHHSGNICYHSGKFGTIRGTFGAIQGTFGTIQGTFGTWKRRSPRRAGPSLTSIWHHSGNIWRHSGNIWHHSGNIWHHSGNIWHLKVQVPETRGPLPDVASDVVPRGVVHQRLSAPHQAIEQRRLAHVGTPDDCNLCSFADEIIMTVCDSDCDFNSIVISIHYLNFL
jgi:hypothetical protein